MWRLFGPLRGERGQNASTRSRESELGARNCWYVYREGAGERRDDEIKQGQKQGRGLERSASEREPKGVQEIEDNVATDYGWKETNSRY